MGCDLYNGLSDIWLYDIASGTYEILPLWNFGCGLYYLYGSSYDRILASPAFSINGDGTRIAIYTNTDPNDFSLNPNIYVMDMNSYPGGWTPIFPLDVEESWPRYPSMSSDGSKIAYWHVTGEDPDYWTSVFLVDAQPGGDITETSFGYADIRENNWSFPQPSSDGTHIAVDLALSIAPGGAWLIDMDYSGPAPSSAITALWPWSVPIEYYVGQTHYPSINADGTKVAFWGSGPDPDLWEGPGLYLLDRAGGTYKYTLITKRGEWYPDYNWILSRPSISADGTRIAFVDSDDLTGENPDFSQELFVYDTVTKTFHQITNLPARAGEYRWIMHPQISADGTRVIFESNIPGLITQTHPTDPDWMQLLTAILPF
jgi:Tol biopolymer transport system component